MVPKHILMEHCNKELKEHILMDSLESILAYHKAMLLHACKVLVCIQMFSWVLNLVQEMKLDLKSTFLNQNYHFKVVKHIQLFYFMVNHYFKVLP